MHPDGLFAVHAEVAPARAEKFHENRYETAGMPAVQRPFRPALGTGRPAMRSRARRIFDELPGTLIRRAFGGHFNPQMGAKALGLNQAKLMAADEPTD
jgi:hypothetical protein